jgi:hypothetical protein
MAGKFSLKMPDFHVAFRDLLHAVNLQHGTHSFTSLPKEGTLRIKRQIGSIEVDWERAATKKYHETVNRFRKGIQPCMNACKDNSEKLIEGDDKILEHWARHFKTQFDKEYSEDESDEDE